jgi:hypothetical protein
LHGFRDEVDEDVEGGAGHDVDEQPENDIVSLGFSFGGYVDSSIAYVVVLSRLWNTRLFRHMAIATALFPKARQYVLIKSRFE